MSFADGRRGVLGMIVGLSLQVGAGVAQGSLFDRPWQRNDRNANRIWLAGTAVQNIHGTQLASATEFPAIGCAGEIHELKEELRAMDRGKRKGAVKKVIAAMTVGKDVSMIFPDVVNCMQVGARPPPRTHRSHRSPERSARTHIACQAYELGCERAAVGPSGKTVATVLKAAWHKPA